MTRWEPDTCGCVFLVRDWDADDADTLVACPAHAGQSGVAHFQQVYRGECQVKNAAVRAALTAAPGLEVDVVPARTVSRVLGGGGGLITKPEPAQRALRPGVEIDFVFDAQRKLSLVISGMTLGERVQAKAGLASAHPGVVLIDGSTGKPA